MLIVLCAQFETVVLVTEGKMSEMMLVLAVALSK